jgi:hypothetical protein
MYYIALNPPSPATGALLDEYCARLVDEYCAGITADQDGESA